MLVLLQTLSLSLFSLYPVTQSLLRHDELNGLEFGTKSLFILQKKKKYEISKIS
jgi:hypothetical protein